MDYLLSASNSTENIMNKKDPHRVALRFIEHLLILSSESTDQIFRAYEWSRFLVPQFRYDCASERGTIAEFYKDSIILIFENLTYAVYIGPHHTSSRRKGLDDRKSEPFKNGRNDDAPGLVVQRIQLIIRNEPQERHIPLQIQPADQSFHFLQMAPLPSNKQESIRNLSHDEVHAPDQEFYAFPFVDASDIQDDVLLWLVADGMKLIRIDGIVYNIDFFFRNMIAID
jgi:hypothetical protein